MYKDVIHRISWRISNGEVHTTITTMNNERNSHKASNKSVRLAGQLHLNNRSCGFFELQ